jgi:arginine kinase
LSQFLKRSVFEKIKRRQTRLDHNLFDVIWPAMKKATQVRQIDEDLNAGIVCPDFDSYVVFQEFLVPLIKDLHCLDLSSTFVPQPEVEYFPTANGVTGNTEPAGGDAAKLHLNLDTSGKFITAGIVECSRNLEHIELPLNLHIGQLEKAERVLTGKLLSGAFTRAIGEKELGSYYTMNEVMENPSEVRTMLSAYGLMIPLLDNSDPYQAAESLAVNGPFYPYGRGVFVSNNCDLVAWINVQEHLRLLCATSMENPGDIGAAYTKMAKAVQFLEKSIEFRHSYLLGSLAARPAYLGTGLRLTLTLELNHLIKEKQNLRHLCTVRCLHMATVPKTDAVRVSNMQSLSVTEWKIFQDYCAAVTNILGLEKELAMPNSMQIADTLLKIFRKKKNSLVDA